jgi:hypothetical protein
VVLLVSLKIQMRIQRTRILTRIFVMIAELKMKNNLLEECVAEAELGRMEIDDKMEILRKAICSKFKRLLSELGRPDLYDRVLPYISKHRIRVASR